MVRSGIEFKYSEFICSALFYYTPMDQKEKKNIGVIAYIRMLNNVYEVPIPWPGTL